MSIIQSLYGEEHEYKVNGATYIVSAAFKHTGRKEDNTSFPTCVKRILTSDFAHLIITEGNDTMAGLCSPQRVFQVSLSAGSHHKEPDGKR